MNGLGVRGDVFGSSTGPLRRRCCPGDGPTSIEGDRLERIGEVLVLCLDNGLKVLEEGLPLTEEACCEGSLSFLICFNDEKQVPLRRKVRLGAEQGRDLNACFSSALSFVIVIRDPPALIVVFRPFNCWRFGVGGL